MCYGSSDDFLVSCCHQVYALPRVLRRKRCWVPGFSEAISCGAERKQWGASTPRPLVLSTRDQACSNSGASGCSWALRWSWVKRSPQRSPASSALRLQLPSKSRAALLSLPLQSTCHTGSSTPPRVTAGQACPCSKPVHSSPVPPSSWPGHLRPFLICSTCFPVRLHHVPCSRLCKSTLPPPPARGYGPCLFPLPLSFSENSLFINFSAFTYPSGLLPTCHFPQGACLGPQVKLTISSSEFTQSWLLGCRELSV